MPFVRLGAGWGDSAAQWWKHAVLRRVRRPCCCTLWVPLPALPHAVYWQHHVGAVSSLQACLVVHAVRRRVACVRGLSPTCRESHNSLLYCIIRVRTGSILAYRQRHCGSAPIRLVQGTVYCSPYCRLSMRERQQQHRVGVSVGVRVERFTHYMRVTVLVVSTQWFGPQAGNEAFQGNTGTKRRAILVAHSVQYS